MAEQQCSDQDQHAQQPALRVPLSTRPQILERTHSSPAVTARHADGQGQGQQQSWQGSLTGAAPQGLGIDTETRSNGFLQTNNDAEHQVNIAVVGTAGVGKSSFIQQSLSLSSQPTTAVSCCRVNIDSAAFLVRMLECQLQDVIIDRDNKITWPTDPRMPTVDAACTLYDITNKDSFEDVPVVLTQRDPALSRRRTISSALAFGQSNRSYPPPSHARASSVQSSTMRKDSRHDSTTMVTGAPNATHSSVDGNTVLDHSRDDMTDSSRSEHASSSEDGGLDVDSQSEAPSDERGYSFDNLVDRLLKLPKSKADTRFGSVFLALYRKFAAPGQLLEAIVHRFEALEQEDGPFMTKTVSQLRYLSVIEQWIGAYPGDFAHIKTRRRMRTFVAKLSNTRIFSAAAREMSCDLDVVTEDDDTNWACCDMDREKRGLLSPDLSWSSRVSTLLDDPDFDFSDNLGSLSLDGGQNRNQVHSLHTDFGMLQTVDAARRQGPSLVPTPRAPINKSHWHMLMETPTDSIACELTRIDWIMFSAVRPRDLVRHVSLSQAQKAQCKSLVHVTRMIDHFNHVRDWVANLILLREKAKHRVLMLEKLMHVARKLREMNNYNSLGAFLAGISSAAVHRLAATRELLSPETGKDWMKLEILMSPTRSYAAYRLAWENSSGERIPFLPLPIRDLVAAAEGNKTYVGDEVNGRINWRKFEVMGETIVGIQKAQGLPYRNSMLGPRNDELRALILNSNMIRDDEALYERSCYIENGDRRGLRELFRRA
ncbi:hypothetical protein QM012_001995 [Aureobasidium pullulans]|uniref:Ras GEF n=1 Tax=Aureobasidium pullulans TaxID=5580 RepID=A0ABR0TD39_AURPU